MVRWYLVHPTLSFFLFLPPSLPSLSAACKRSTLRLDALPPPHVPRHCFYFAAGLADDTMKYVKECVHEVKTFRRLERERENKYRSRNLFLTTMGRDGGPYIALQLNRYAIAMSWDLVFSNNLGKSLSFDISYVHNKFRIEHILYSIYIFRFIFICTIKYNLVYKIISNSFDIRECACARACANKLRGSTNRPLW